ncbi:MAG: glutamine-hydrolyzing GMP synthase, partial [Patescibacteria group bacterium]|nr:glutamine-hydrolyzing GMP synthase [Patescibacteria group bacterium]
MIYVLDFGGQTAHLITRRLKELGVATKFIVPEHAMSELTDKIGNVKQEVKGIILSGGPMSVYEDGAPTVDPKLFSLSVPSLDICYGLQLRSHLLNGKVVSGTKEYGPVHLTITNHSSPITKDLPKEATVWMSHGDSVLSMPENFKIIGSSESVPYAFVVDDMHKQYGVQFHPEIEHTEIGMQILKNFIDICGITKQVQALNPDAMIGMIKQTVGEAHIIGAVSGGVDSTVAATLVAKAIGTQFTPIFVNNGLMRPDAVETVRNLFHRFDIVPIVCEVEDEMLKKLEGVTDSEEKRKVIGNFYVEVFEREMAKLVKKDHDVKFLLQGTIYSDVIESQGTKHASKIKSHHNVGGLPEHMKLVLLEPLRELYKDEVRMLGSLIGLPEEFVQKQPFPGPGYAVRIRGEVTKKRLAQEKQADAIVLEELRKADWLHKVFISFPVMTDAYSTAVKGDGRFFGEVVALRVIESKDIMSSTWAKLPYDLLQRISSRIVN